MSLLRDTRDLIFESLLLLQLIYPNTYVELRLTLLVLYNYMSERCAHRTC